MVAALDSQEAYSPAYIPTQKEFKTVRLELEDGSVYLGYSFGAEVEASGECVFQTGK